MESEARIKERLLELGKTLRGVKAGGRSYQIIMAEIDRLLGTESPESNPELDAQWERGHR